MQMLRQVVRGAGVQNSCQGISQCCMAASTAMLHITGTGVSYEIISLVQETLSQTFLIFASCRLALASSTHMSSPCLAESIAFWNLPGVNDPKTAPR